MVQELFFSFYFFLAVLDAPQTLISEISLLTNFEKEFLIKDLNNTKVSTFLVISLYFFIRQSSPMSQYTIFSCNRLFELRPKQLSSK
jgi:hypothetical protein